MRARDNLFASHRLERLSYRFLSGSWTVLAERLTALGGRGAIVGPEGSGKTTLLEQFASRLRGGGREVVLVPAEPELGPRRDLLARALAESTPDTVLFVDAGDALSTREWRRLERSSRRFGGLVLTAHRDGLLPTLARTVTSVGLLSQLVEELVGPRAVREIDLAGLHARHGGDLRAALRELYDRCATGLLGGREPARISAG